MIVVIIVGILASVAIPMYHANVRKSMATEGSSLLGAVLSAQRLYYAEYSTYTTDKSVLNVSETGNRYFSDYSVSAAGSSGFTASSTGSAEASGVTVTMTYTNAAGASISYSGL